MEEWYRHVHPILYLKEEEGSDQEAQLIIEALRLKPGDRVLDAPCAAGRISVRLARAGCLVTGVDINEEFLQLARERLQSEGLPGTFLNMDVRRLPFHEEFDAALNWWASFGYFSDEENLETLRGMSGAVRPGGRVLIEQPNREFVLRRLAPVVEGDPWLLLSRWDPVRERIESHWILRLEGRNESYPMSMRWYTPAQLRRLFRRAGLEPEEAYGDYDGSPYQRSSPRLILVGRKEV